VSKGVKKNEEDEDDEDEEEEDQIYSNPTSVLEKKEVPITPTDNP